MAGKSSHKGCSGSRESKHKLYAHTKLLLPGEACKATAKDNAGLSIAFPKCRNTLIPKSVLALTQKIFFKPRLGTTAEVECLNTPRYPKLKETQKEEEAKVYSSHWL